MGSSWCVRSVDMCGVAPSAIFLFFHGSTDKYVLHPKNCIPSVFSWRKTFILERHDKIGCVLFSKNVAAWLAVSVRPKAGMTYLRSSLLDYRWVHVLLTVFLLLLLVRIPRLLCQGKSSMRIWGPYICGICFFAQSCHTLSPPSTSLAVSCTEMNSFTEKCDEKFAHFSIDTDQIDTGAQPVSGVSLPLDLEELLSLRIRYGPNFG